MIQNDKIWRKDGKVIPLEECTAEQLVARFNYVNGLHADKVAELVGANEALKKRLVSHRKAKALANKRADDAVKMMREMANNFQKTLDGLSALG